MKPALALLLLFANAATSACDDASHRPVASGPSIILIVVDTLRADRLTQYGHTRDTSSALSQLTDASVRFQDCTSPAPWTAPSVASLFTGLAPARHQVDRIGQKGSSRKGDCPKGNSQKGGCPQSGGQKAGCEEKESRKQGSEEERQLIINEAGRAITGYAGLNTTQVQYSGTQKSRRQH